MNCQFFKLNRVNQDGLFFSTTGDVKSQHSTLTDLEVIVPPFRGCNWANPFQTSRSQYPAPPKKHVHWLFQQDMQQSSGQEAAVVSLESHLPAMATFCYSLPPNLFIPVLERSGRKAVSEQERPVWCITKCRENNLLYETVGGFSAQTHILSLLHLSTWLRYNWGGDYLKQNICSF